MENIGLKVKAPEKWMNGWNKLYVNALEELKSNINEINESDLRYPVQQFFWFTKNSDNFEEIKNKTLLEFACGDGTISCYMAKNGYVVKAFDALENSVKLTKERAKILNISEDLLKVEKGDMSDYPKENEKYDVIIALQCIQYMFEDAITKIEQIKEAIKPGGYFIYSGNVLPHEDTGDIKIRFVTQDELRDLFKKWTIHTLGREEILLKQDPEIKRGYTWIVAQKKI